MINGTCRSFLVLVQREATDLEIKLLRLHYWRVSINNKTMILDIDSSKTRCNVLEQTRLIRSHKKRFKLDLCVKQREFILVDSIYVYKTVHLKA